MKAIIVDDEPKAIELIESYLVQFQEIEVAATFRNGLKALAYLKDNRVDLIFLDINMPHLSGLSLSRITAPDVKVIFVTAHAEYAPESYEVEAADYLMKPVSFERFTRAVHRVLKDRSVQPAKILPEEILSLKSSGNIYRVILADIYFLEKAANYMAYHIAGKKLLVRQAASEALNELPSYFVQVHKSYIVNTRKIEFYNKEEISIKGVKIPLGNTYRDAFIQYMQNRGL